MKKRKALWMVSVALFLPFLLLISIIAAQKVEKSNGDIIIRFDDYGVWCNQDWLEIEKDLIDVHEKYGIKISFATIPESRYTLNYHPLSPKAYPKEIENKDFNPYPLQEGSERVNILKESVSKGISEVTLHGFYHPKGYSNNLNTEFYGIPYDVQYYKLSQGKRILDSLFNTNVITLVPPHNTYDNLTLDLLEDIGYKCISAKRPTATAPVSMTGNIACLWHTNSDFHELINYFKRQEHFTNEPTPVLMLHHTSFTTGGGYNSPLMHEYESFLKVLHEKNVSDYHFADICEDASFIKKNNHTRKELFYSLLGLGLSNRMAVKAVELDHFMPSSLLFVLIVFSLILLLTGISLLTLSLMQGKAKQYFERNIKKILWPISVLMVVYGIYVLFVFSKLQLIGWPMLLSFRFILLYLLISLVLSILSYLLISKK